MSQMLLRDLIALVPRPDSLVDAGTLEVWDAIRREIDLQIPSDLIEFSIHYGSGHFVDGDFSLDIENVFDPKYVDLIKYRRGLAESAKRAGQDIRQNVFIIGWVIWRGEENGTYVFWDTRGPMQNWPICIPTESAPQQRFEMPLLEFLVRAFRNELKVERFPHEFGNLQFVRQGENYHA